MNMKAVYEKAIQDIKIGEKYTIFGFGEFGFPSVTHTVIEKIYIGSYAQYDNALFIVHRPKRKRTSYKMVIYSDKTIYIWKGWQDINAEMYDKPEHNNGMTVRKSLFSSFDKNYITNGINSIKEKPIAILDRDYHTNTNDMEFIYQVVYSDQVKYYNSIDELTIYHDMMGNCQNNSVRIELKGQPILKGLLGAMWGGYKEGIAVIRYETQDVYNTYAI